MKHECVSTGIPRKKLLQRTVRVAEGVSASCSLRKMFDRRRRPRSQEAKEDEILGGERESRSRILRDYCLGGDSRSYTLSTRNLGQRRKKKFSSPKCHCGSLCDSLSV
ncbi:hypothetical protein PIB30_064536 [Stylosanthes scabra]|uniref:Uncharacterized protein n=1 Tax=Stylosanthes scabra TaxID=79078 RepID=A0ABU6VMR1_9FABA|nr:hypothetical protein [Stylosanthes scabra]